MPFLTACVLKALSERLGTASAAACSAGPGRPAGGCGGGEGWGRRAGGLAPRQHLPRPQVLPIPATPSSSEGSASGPFGVNYSNPGFSV